MKACIIDEDRIITNVIEIDEETKIPGLEEYIPGLWIGDKYPTLAEMHSELKTLSRVIDTLLSV